VESFQLVVDLWPWLIAIHIKVCACPPSPFHNRHPRMYLSK
jgi:uncharacterized Zn-finger protein